MSETQHNQPDKTEQIKGYIQLAFVAAFIIGSFTLSALLGVKKAPVRGEDAPVRVLSVEAMRVAPGAHQISFDATGLIKARAEIDISPQVSGRIISVNDNVFAGGTFEPGELLFHIDPTDYQLAVKSLEATVAQARTAYDLEKAESAIALAEWKQLQGDAPVPPLVARKPQMAEALASLKAAQAQLDDATLDLERTVFALPFKGRVVSSMLSTGQHVSAGQSYGTAYDMQGLEIQVSLDEQKLAWLLETAQPDITVKVRYKGTEHSFKGVLKRSAAELDSATRFAQVAIGFDDSALQSAQASEALLPGLFAAVSIGGPVLDDLIAIPARAVQKGGTIWVIDPATQTVKAATPDIVYSDGARLLLRGFDNGALIVTSKLPGGSDGMTVDYTVVKPEAGLAPLPELQASMTNTPMVMPR